jgi:hypothetical protein
VRFKKNLPKKYISIHQRGEETPKTINFGGKLSFILSFLFAGAPPLLRHIFSLLLTVGLLYYNLPGTAQFCPHRQTPRLLLYIRFSLEPCALNAEYHHFILKCFYFADTTERGERGDRWSRKEAQRQGEEKVTLRITLIALIADAIFHSLRTIPSIHKTHNS